MKNNLLVLGASSDIATAILPRIAGNYDNIYAHYHSASDKLMKIKESCPCNIKLIQSDFNDEEDTKRAIDEVVSDNVEITHILHCPSARLQNKRFKECDWNDYGVMLNTQLRSLFYAANAFLPSMAKKKYGKVVVIVSSCSYGTPPAFMNPYVTAKYAQLGFVKSLAKEYAGKSVQINAVSPSMMETKFLSNIPSIIAEQSAASNPLKRNATADDVLPVIELLLSDDSGFITGQNILISGGEII